MQVTAKQFEEMTGFKPEDDDLDRTNCEKAGGITHTMCGVCQKCRKPRFVCGHPHDNWD